MPTKIAAKQSNSRRLGQVQILQFLLHALSCLSGHINTTHRVKLGFCDMQMSVQAAAFTPLCDDGKIGLGHIPHEQQDVHMSSLPAKKCHHVKKFILSSVKTHLHKKCDNMNW